MTIRLILIITLFASLLSAQQKTDTLKFSHKMHIEDQGLSCLDCHTGVSNDSKGSGNYPAMEVCGQCHEGDISYAAKSSKNVQLHKNFSHSAHLKENSDCTICHKGVKEATTTTISHAPSMENCMGCHNAKKASDECSLCHQDLQKIKPQSHKSPWFLKKEHGREASFSSSRCESCHQESTCDACHMGNTSTKIHDPGFTFTHGTEARKGDMNCAVCHEVNNSCIQCHTSGKP